MSSRDLIHQAIRSRGPILRRDMVSFVRRVDIDGVGDRQTMSFEREILWLAESESQWLLRQTSGQEIKTSSRHNDFYGFLTSYEDLEVSAQKFAAELRLSPDSPLRVDLEVSLVEQPVLAAPDWMEQEATSRSRRWGRNLYLPVPKDWFVNSDKSRACLGEGGRPDRSDRLADRTTIMVLWSSAYTAAENAEARFGLSLMRAAHVERLRQEEAQP